jgi:hypothetical protein
MPYPKPLIPFNLHSRLASTANAPKCPPHQCPSLILSHPRRQFLQYLKHLRHIPARLGLGHQ